MARIHALYRFYDHAEDLLYVGITVDPGARWRQHRGEKDWWHEVGRIAIETHPDRIEVLAAEKAAIITEQPRYNVVHNVAPARLEERRESLVPGPYDSTVNLWTYRNRQSGNQFTTDLHLRYEVNGTAISDDFLPEEIDAPQLLRIWNKRYGKEQVSIFWAVTPPWEVAPFQQAPWSEAENFLTYFTWPTHQVTGEPLNWNRLPVTDLDWSEAGDKGGFFQEATGWKPAPLQSHVPLADVFAAAGLPGRAQ